MTTSLEAMASQALALASQQRAERESRIAEEKATKEKAAEAVLGALLVQVLTPEFLAQITLGYKHEYDPYRHTEHKVLAFFPYGDVDWNLTYTDPTSYSHNAPKGPWMAFLSRPGLTFQVELLGNSLTDEELQPFILTKMGALLALAREAERQRLAAVTYDEEKRQERQIREQQEATSRAVLIAAADAEHQRLTLLFHAGLTAAQKALWTWPTGVTVPLYEVHYCVGGSCDAEQGVSFDHREGWSSVDTLDEQGYIRLESTRPYSVPTAFREVKLDPAVHHVYWVRRVFSSLDALPDTLKEPVEFSLPLVVMRRDSDNQCRLVAVEAYEEYTFGNVERPYTQKAGEQPLSWVRALIEAAASEK